MYKRKIS